jgi:AcrR family transcriptional regulator
MELYVERGFENTTVAEIAERAGLTERTFFRHFADKREVLFAGSEALRDLLADSVTGAPGSAAPIEVVAAALETVGAVLQERGDWSKQRQAVIAANAELRERELIKLAGLAETVGQALRARGLKDPTATLTAEAGIAAFRVAFERWVQQPGKRNLPRLIRESFDELRLITTGS